MKRLLLFVVESNYSGRHRSQWLERTSRFLRRGSLSQLFHLLIDLILELDDLLSWNAGIWDRSIERLRACRVLRRKDPLYPLFVVVFKHAFHIGDLANNHFVFNAPVKGKVTDPLCGKQSVLRRPLADLAKWLTHDRGILAGSDQLGLATCLNAQSHLVCPIFFVRHPF